MWNKNERDGKIDPAKGKVKQAVGDLTHDDDLKAEGQVDEAVGKVEAGTHLDQDIHKGAMEEDRPGPEQREAPALDGDGLPNDETAIAQDALGAAVDQSQG